jgi:hypothetical protein
MLIRAETYLQVSTVLDNSYGPTKWLLVLVPIAIAVGICGMPAEAVFFLNFTALVLLAGLIIFTVLGLTRYAGVSPGPLRAILGNATELIVRRACLSRSLPFCDGSLTHYASTLARHHCHVLWQDPTRPMDHDR